jgi:hypothetical protein
MHKELVNNSLSNFRCPPYIVPPTISLNTFYFRFHNLGHIAPAQCFSEQLTKVFLFYNEVD